MHFACNVKFTLLAEEERTAFHGANAARAKDGTAKGKLCTKLYVDMTSDDSVEFERTVGELAKEITRLTGAAPRSVPAVRTWARAPSHRRPALRCGVGKRSAMTQARAPSQRKPALRHGVGPRSVVT